MSEFFSPPTRKLPAAPTSPPPALPPTLVPPIPNTRNRALTESHTSGKLLAVTSEPQLSKYNTVRGAPTPVTSNATTATTITNANVDINNLQTTNLSQKATLHRNEMKRTATYAVERAGQDKEYLSFIFYYITSLILSISYQVRREVRKPTVGLDKLLLSIHLLDKSNKMVVATDDFRVQVRTLFGYQHILINCCHKGLIICFR